MGIFLFLAMLPLGAQNYRFDPTAIQLYPDNVAEALPVDDYDKMSISCPTGQSTGFLIDLSNKDFIDLAFDQLYLANDLAENIELQGILKSQDGGNETDLAMIHFMDTAIPNSTAMNLQLDGGDVDVTFFDRMSDQEVSLNLPAGSMGNLVFTNGDGAPGVALEGISFWKNKQDQHLQADLYFKEWLSWDIQGQVFEVEELYFRSTQPLSPEFQQWSSFQLESTTPESHIDVYHFANAYEPVTINSLATNDVVFGETFHLSGEHLGNIQQISFLGQTLNFWSIDEHTIAIQAPAMIGQSSLLLQTIDGTTLSSEAININPDCSKAPQFISNYFFIEEDGNIEGKFNWDANNAYASSFEIKIKNKDEEDTAYITYTTLENSFTIDGLEEEQSYLWSVRYFCPISNSYSEWSTPNIMTVGYSDQLEVTEDLYNAIVKFTYVNDEDLPGFLGGHPGLDTCEVRAFAQKYFRESDVLPGNGIDEEECNCKTIGINTAYGRKKNTGIDEWGHIDGKRGNKAMKTHKLEEHIGVVSRMKVLVEDWSCRQSGKSTKTIAIENNLAGQYSRLHTYMRYTLLCTNTASRYLSETCGCNKKVDLDAEVFVKMRNQVRFHRLLGVSEGIAYTESQLAAFAFHEKNPQDIELIASDRGARNVHYNYSNQLNPDFVVGAVGFALDIVEIVAAIKGIPIGSLDTVTMMNNITTMLTNKPMTQTVEGDQEDVTTFVTLSALNRSFDLPPNNSLEISLLQKNYVKARGLSRGKGARVKKSDFHLEAGMASDYYMATAVLNYEAADALCCHQEKALFIAKEYEGSPHFGQTFPQNRQGVQEFLYKHGNYGPWAEPIWYTTNRFRVPDFLPFNMNDGVIIPWNDFYDKQRTDYAGSLYGPKVCAPNWSEEYDPHMNNTNTRQRAEQEASNLLSASVSPNPANGLFQLHVVSNTRSTNQAIPGSIKVYDILGKNVMSSTITPPNQVFSIDLSTQPNGIYILKIQHQGEEKMLKLIKQ